MDSRKKFRALCSLGSTPVNGRNQGQIGQRKKPAVIQAPKAWAHVARNAETGVLGVMLWWAPVSAKGCRLSGKRVTLGRRVSATGADPRTAGIWSTTAADVPPTEPSLAGDARQRVSGSTGQV